GADQAPNAAKQENGAPPGQIPVGDGQQHPEREIDHPEKPPDKVLADRRLAAIGGDHFYPHRLFTHCLPVKKDLAQGEVQEQRQDDQDDLPNRVFPEDASPEDEEPADNVHICENDQVVDEPGEEALHKGGDQEVHFNIETAVELDLEHNCPG